MRTFCLASFLAALSAIGIATAAAAADAIQQTPLHPTGDGGFRLVPPIESGIDFVNQVTPETVGRHVTLIASGLAAGDVDGDGLCDLYFCRIDGSNVLYKNLGDWRFQDVTDRAGVACPDRHSIGATFADVDGDGDLDLLTTARGGPTALFRNDGSGRFAEDDRFPLVGLVKAGTSPAFADVDGDGDLDLYVPNYRSKAYADDHLLTHNDPWRQSNVEKLRQGGSVDPDFAAQFFLYRGEVQEKGESDDFLLNDGIGSFVPAPEGTFGATPSAPGHGEGWGLAAQWRDRDGDGDPDLYVCNDFHTPDRMWINNGSGRFVHAPDHAQRRQSYYAMAVDAADVDHDGHLDLFVADMMSRHHDRKKRQMGAMGGMAPQADVFGAVPQIMQNTLFRSRGDGTYAEIAQYAGVKASEWTWGAIFMDVDLDGWADLVTSTGMVHDWMDADTQKALAPGDASMEEVRKRRSQYPVLRTRNLVFRNRGDHTFEEIGTSLGIEKREVSGGFVTADLDNDGDLDLIYNNFGAPAEVYRNDETKPRLAVRLRGSGMNTRAVGAQVRLNGQSLTQQAEVLSGGRYASHCDDQLTFAIPAKHGPYSLSVTWRDGTVTTIPDVAPNNLLTIKKSDARQPQAALTPASQVPLFREEPNRLRHFHRENTFDDFAKQPLLPRRFSRLGPGVTWCDLDADGDDDLLVGASADDAVAVFINDGDRFVQVAKQVGHLRLAADTTTMLTAPQDQGATSILLGRSIWEDVRDPVSVRLLLVDREKVWRAGGEVGSGTVVSGPLALGDVNGDGRPDLFVGGRMLAGQYPAPVSSHVMLDEDPARKEANPKRWSEAFKEIGMVSGAVMADFDGDGKQDVALAREWGAPTLMRNTGSGFEDVGTAWGLANHTGWWNGIATGDFDGDGRLDLIATNWGENSKYGHAPGKKSPLQIRYGDVDGNGTFDVIEAHKDKLSGKLVPGRGLSCSSTAIPFLRKRIPTYKAFGNLDLVGVYGDKLGSLKTISAAELRHAVFLNRGDHFAFSPLPTESQWAPAFGTAVADFDGDGDLDVFLAQNHFSTQPETPRCDAGRGLLLLGRGDGSFEPADAAFSGIAIYGEQRACATADYDGDGRADLVVTQNNGATRLLRNQLARPGIRVRCDAGPDNRSGIGTIVRPVTKSGLGAARVVTAGSGYLSQDSCTLVVTAPEPISAIAVIWPNGEAITVPVAAGQRNLVISATDQ